MLTENTFTDLSNESEKLKVDVNSLQKKRKLYYEIKGINNIMCGIYGLRGTGKTTILLQIARERENSLYINAENLIFRGVSILEFIEFSIRKGFANFFIDEIHVYVNWSRELKLLYDKGIRNIFFSGSSSMKVQEQSADLSRRALLFHLKPLSFREFLELITNKQFEILKFDEIIEFSKRKKLIAEIAPYVNYFDEYSKFGPFPFYFLQKDRAYDTYTRIVEKIIRIDLASLGKIDINYIESVYKLLNTIAISNPNEMNYNFLAKQTNRNLYLVEGILKALGDIGLIYSVLPFKKGAALLRKENKFLFAPPFRLTLAKNLGFGFEQVIGGIREDIFITNVASLNPRYIKTERERRTPDYVLNDLSFELGSHEYKCDTDFYVKDNLIIDEKIIPLQLFCMFY